MTLLKNKTLTKLYKSVYNVRDVIIFLVISVVIIEGWKLLNLDAFFSPVFSNLFQWLMSFEYAVSTFLMKFFLPIRLDKTSFLITFDQNQSVYLYEGCSGLKQVIQFTLIMLIYPGSWRKKAWFLPLSVVMLIIAAIIHFIFLCIILYHFPVKYEFMHDNISRWFFFFVFFLLWVFFTWKSPISTTAGSKTKVDPG